MMEEDDDGSSHCLVPRPLPSVQRPVRVSRNYFLSSIHFQIFLPHIHDQRTSRICKLNKKLTYRSSELTLWPVVVLKMHQKEVDTKISNLVPEALKNIYQFESVQVYCNAKINLLNKLDRHKTLNQSTSCTKNGLRNSRT